MVTYAGHIPKTLTGAAKQFPAYEKWTDEYFLNHPAAKTSLISLERGRPPPFYWGIGYDVTSYFTL